MGTKRTHTQMDQNAPTNSNTGSSNQTAPRFSDHRPRKYPRYAEKDGQGGKETDRGDAATGRARKRARTIERRLQHPKPLPANVRNDLERELASLRSTIDGSYLKKQRFKMISKYHMVRFFERRKAERLLRQLRRELESTSSPSDVARLEKDVHIAEVDVAYTTYFPHLETYVSLYPALKHKNNRASADDANDQAAASMPAKEALHLQRHHTWAEVEDAMAQGQAALERLRDRRTNADPNSIPTEANPSRGSNASSSRKKDAKDKDQEDIIESSTAHKEDSDDGGFFE